jgi:hypothetical protein
MIISDLMKMVVVLAFMFYMNWKLTWIVVGYFSSYHSGFQRKMQVALRKFVRKYQYEFLCARTSNRYENRATFTREIIEADKFKEINDKHKRHGLKPLCTTSASIILSLVSVMAE